MKSAVFWDVTPNGSCKNRHFGETYRLNHQSDKNRRIWDNVSCNYVFLRCVLQLLVTDDVDPLSQIFVALVMEATCSSETLVLSNTA
jgi:hypothetical protein